MKRRNAQGESHEMVPLSENDGAGSSYDSMANSFNNDLPGGATRLRMLSIGSDSIAELQDVDELDEVEQELMESLPSSRLRQMRGITSSGTLRLRKTELTDVNVDGPVTGRNDTNNGDEIAIGDVSIQGLDSYDSIRNMATTLQRKKSVRLMVQKKERNAKRISGWQNFKYTNEMKFIQFNRSIREAFSEFRIWEGHMKSVEGLFGTGVLSYFTFLRWILYINLLVCILTISFLFIPQIIYTKSTRTNNNTFTGLELLTGEGWFTKSELYYGVYTSEKINNVYNMKYAYLCVGGGYLLLCIIILAASMAKSYKENYIDGSDSVSPYAAKVFSSWDFAISNKESAQMKSQQISQDLRETLGTSSGTSKKNHWQWLRLILVHLSTNFICLLLVVGSVYLILYVSEKVVKGVIVNTKENDLEQLIPAVTISAINWIMPSAFAMIASIESYGSPKTQLKVTLIRTIILKLASLIAYVVALNTELTSTKDIGSFCWETYIGQAFYKLVVVDFLYVILSIFFGEFLRDVFAKYLKCCHGYRPGFDISKNVLNLVYAQGITWMGTFYCPLLPVINVIKLIITFYGKRISVERNCRPSMRPFKASKMLVVFQALLSLMLILSLILIGYIIMEDNTLHPSKQCGPFNGASSIYSIVWLIIGELPPTLKEIISVLSSLSVLAAILFLCSLLAYYFRMRKKSSEKKIKLLQHQISLAGQDKQYLIKKLRFILTDTPSLVS